MPPANLTQSIRQWEKLHVTELAELYHRQARLEILERNPTQKLKAVTSMYQLQRLTCSFAEWPFSGFSFVTHQLKNPRFYLLILSDTLLFTLALVMAYLLRFEFLLLEPYKTQITTLLPWLIPTKLIVFFLSGLYRGMWRYTGMDDFWRLAQACFASSLLMVLIVLTAYSFIGFPRSVFLLDCLLTFVLAGSLRVMIRCFYSARNGSQGVKTFLTPTLRSSRQLREEHPDHRGRRLG